MEPVVQPPRRLGHRPALDGLRGVAILLVLSEHLALLPQGYVGVDLFFALSGFLITSLLYEEWDRAGAISLRRFYGRRVRRLAPALIGVMLLTLVVGVALYAQTGWPIGKKLLTTSLFVNNWVGAFGHSDALGPLGPTWSLGQEEQFYLLWPAILLFLLRRHISPHGVAALLMAAIVGLLLLSPHLIGDDLYYAPAPRAAELLLGCLCSVLWRHRLVRLPGAMRRRVPSRLEVGPELMQGACSIIACVLVYLFARALLHHTSDSERVYLFACVVGALLIVLALVAPQNPVAHALSFPALRYVGRISYCLYLVHMLVLDVLMHYASGLSIVDRALLTLIISLALSALSWHLLESRILGHSQRPAPRRPAWAAARA